MAPYEPNPYRNTSNTGLSQLLAQQDKQKREVAESMKIDRIMDEVREMRYKVDELDRKIYGPRFGDVNMYPLYEDEPEPSVEENEVELPNWFERLLSDPFWEIFKRPTL